MGKTRRAEHAHGDATTAQAGERADLTAWRRRHELRRSNGAQPIPSKPAYRRVVKHRQRY
ncbi:hypothetical protein [Nocardia mexicana]|uniref:Uncharacterized protein n=1 Tax=Nocardia mexicana TaxID=279262 RepID=A0A370H168_9NOCA|nr:hypothetical protein [Nocardia mexicana]RDI49756.1 hypothetical protein DFR68_106193 [Nocardia mexicana]